MKKITWLTIIAAALLGVLVLCCNGDISDATVKGEGITAEDTLNITVTTDENIKIFKPVTENSSRTITAEAFELSDSDADNSDGNTLDFYLYGKSTNNKVLQPKLVDVTSTDGINGTVTLDIDCYNWELTLAVCEHTATAYTTEADIVDNAVLIGYANVDMMFTNAIKFTLSPKGLKKHGSVSLIISRDGDWPIPNGYVATANIFRLDTKEKILGGLSNDQDLEQILADYSAATPEDTFSTSSPVYTANSQTITPGSYLFEIRFKKENENREYVWNDTIIILPGKTTTSITDNTGALTTNIVIPNLIGTIPEAPDSFAVDYDSPAYNEQDGFYVANFTWTADNTKTEKNFAMDLIELSSEATVPASWDDTAWDTFTGTTTNIEKSWTFDYLNDVHLSYLYKEGSLFANRYNLKLYLELGKRYMARLASENDAGKSDFVYVSFPTDYSIINQYQITYHLQQGTWTESGDKYTDQIYYYGQQTTPYTVIIPTGDGTTGNPLLKAGPATWNYWSQGVGGDKFEDTTYAGFANLDLYAVYMREGDIIVYNDNDYDILEGYVNGFGDQTLKKGETNTFSNSEGTITSTTVSLTLPSGTEWKYDKVLFEITYGGRTYLAQEQVGKEAGTANEFTVNLANMPTGYIYNCKLTAHYQKTVVSYPFTISLTD